MPTTLFVSYRSLIQLTLTPGLGPIRIRRLFEYFNSADEICSASVNELQHVEGIGSILADQIHRSIRQAADDVDAELELIAEHNVSLLAINEPAYPQLLRQIQDPPPLLYYRGTLEDLNGSPTVALVGSRRCSHYGREQAARFAAGLAQANFTIVSGGARGIDTAAHHGALNVNGRTLVVVGCGLANVYPRENADLFERVAQGPGAVISEFPMLTPPHKENFPRRNRTISGLALGTLVIEASNRSGALITARLACEDHNREVMVLPGRVDVPTAAGCIKLLKEGWARPVMDVADVLEALDEAGAHHLLQVEDLSNSQTRNGHAKSTADESAVLFTDSTPTSIEINSLKAQSLTESQRQIYDELDETGEPIDLDELAQRTNLEVATLQIELTMLQISGLVTRSPAAGVQRSR